MRRAATLLVAVASLAVLLGLSAAAEAAAVATRAGGAAAGTAAAGEDAVKALDMSSFRENVEGHELSYVFFYTKKGKDWEGHLATFKEGAALVRAQHPGVLCGIVDLDDNSPLALYTKYNSVDVMIFYPDFVPTPLRFHGNYSADGMLQSAARLVQYTDRNMRAWSDPRQLVADFMDVKFKGDPQQKGINASSQIVAQAEFAARKINVYLEFLQLMKKDVANLVETSNSLRYKLHNSKDLELRNATSGAYDNEERFLDQKLRLGVADDFLQHMFPKRQLPKLHMKTSKFLNDKEDARKQQMALDAAAAPPACEELM
jgi:hypothetical protein